MSPAQEEGGPGLPSSDPVTIGIDVGGTKTLGVTMAPGSILDRVVIPTRRGPRGVLDTVAEVYGALAQRSGGRPVQAVGIGIPGMVDAGSGVVSHAVNLELEEVPLAAQLQAETGVSVAVENDVNVAALGASVATGPVRSIALLNLGTGLAVGVVLDGHIYRGSTGAVGEIGHIPVDLDGDRCGCGQTGCLELAVSGTAYRRVLESADTPHADRASTRFFDRLAWTVQLITVSMDVERIVLSGGVTAHRQVLIEGLTAALERRASSSAFIASLALASRVTVLDPEFPAGAVGAAMYGLASRPATTVDRIVTH